MPLGKRTFLKRRMVVPLRNRYFTAIDSDDSFSVRKVTDKHKLAGYYNKYC